MGNSTIGLNQVGRMLGHSPGSPGIIGAGDNAAVSVSWFDSTKRGSPNLAGFVRGARWLRDRCKMRHN